MNVENIERQAAPDDFSPYNARVSLHTILAQLPHSGPAMNQIFSLHGAFK